MFESGQPADMPIIEERLAEVEGSTTKLGQKVIRKAVISLLKLKTDDLGGNAVIELVTSYGKHNDVHEKCSFVVAVRGTAVRFTD